MDYHPSILGGSGAGGGGVDMPRRQCHVHANRREMEEQRSPTNPNGRMTPHRHHATSDSAEAMGGEGAGSDVGIHEAYETIKEEQNDSCDSDNDRNERKMTTLSPDIQYWFDQKKKIDQLLLPLAAEKGTSPAPFAVKNLDRNRTVQTSAVPKSPAPRPPVKMASNLPRPQPKMPGGNLMLQQQIHQQNSSMSGERDFNDRHLTKKIFDDGGKISAKDLKEAFATFQNKHFSDGVCKFVVRLFDLDRNGGLDIKEFEQLYSYIKLWVSAYHVYDRHHAGYLTEKDFHNALKHMDIHFSPEFISFLVTRCDPINRRVSLSQFIVTCVQIQKYTDEFKNRDDTYSGTINLRYEDFLEMVLRCL